MLFVSVKLTPEMTSTTVIGKQRSVWLLQSHDNQDKREPGTHFESKSGALQVQ